MRIDAEVERYARTRARRCRDREVGREKDDGCHELWVDWHLMHVMWGIHAGDHNYGLYVNSESKEQTLSCACMFTYRQSVLLVMQ